jgi:catechol 2,3-dioxygenase-like lactoylglutathione lyase family enzyme
MTIIGLDSVVYGVEDMAAGCRFFADWGLARTRSNRRETVFETAQGTQVVLRPANAAGLPAAVGKGSTAREIVWGVKTRRDLDAIEKALAGDGGVRRDDDGAVRTTDPNGYGLGFALWRHAPLKAGRQPVNHPAARERQGRRGRLYDRAFPSRLGHVVFTVPDFREAEDWYVRRLGFHVSDRQPGRAVYLRCAPASDHHNLFFMKRPEPRPAFHHLAFEVRDVHEMFGGGLFMRSRGWPTSIGPGRHVVSTAYYWYFRNPCGGAVEYFADADFPDEKWRPRNYTPGRSTFAEWSLLDGLERFGMEEKKPTGARSRRNLKSIASPEGQKV